MVGTTSTSSTVVSTVPSTTPIAPAPAPPTNPKDIPCTCGVFLSGQFVKGSDAQPRGNAALLHELMVPFPCTPVGLKQCINRCLDTIVKHLPNSPAILCGSIDRDCYKERAYLFVKNCSDKWVNTNLSAGREYCCKDGVPYKCPIMS
ncbi:follicle cell protein 3C-1 [Schistocerca americana]|uniref:follicle cell protein 3C-1 n=1 Tax=Schistocerca americana TaxID=7009 RepID=UPI001F4FC01A|nr:follicle cell protein 3C-1 [Schistocerca americana]XP_047106274.1 follicle cell protein 3C-1 [Schistocerca piceifrons]XP_049772337.1 follicle cell protein 3C-1 [Schistocerca cancellata]XP_049799799.1 follicle cell protein 3C-1 [Schistocerca nitens]